MVLLALQAALAGEPLAVEVHGDVKTFLVAGDARPWFGLSDAAAAAFAAEGVSEAEALDAYGLAAEPFSQGTGSARLKGTLTGGAIRVDVHWALAAQTPTADTGVAGLGTGVGLTAPELLPLSWSPDVGDGLVLRHRFDRLVLAARLPHVALALGRQPVSFGSGRFFTPLDLVNPFHPATIDPEYKPGVDAARVDVYAGTSGRVTAVAAWAGDPVIGDHARSADTPLIDDLVLAGTGQVTVGVSDLVGFVGSVHGEPVIGVGTESAVGAVGLHGEATFTLAAEEGAFVRAVVGADGRPGATTSVSGEVYLQSFGATDPADYLAAAEGVRFARGEVWQLGQLYAAAAVGQELTPLVRVNASVVANLRDPSALLALGGSWSVADDAELGFGGYYGLGAAPDIVDLDLVIDPISGAPTLATTSAPGDAVNSEFGLYPGMVYVQLKVYF